MMYFRRHITPKTLCASIALAVLLPSVVVFAASQQDLIDAKDQFNELWDTAAATSKKRAELEAHLVNMDINVTNAKRNLEKAALTQKDMQEKIEDRKRLAVVLQEQLMVAKEAHRFYAAIALTQKDDIVSFVRYLSMKDIALTDSGPAVGGDLVKKLVRGSLGESIDASLAESALMRARRRFSQQIGVIVAEADKVSVQLQATTEDLQKELVSLGKQEQTLHSAAEKNKAVIDDHWRQKQLTEEELKRVEEETIEVNAKVTSMQGSLLKINAELKEVMLKRLQLDLAKAQATLDSIEKDRLSSERKIEAMTLIQDDALRALQLAMKMKNTDTKLYKTIELDTLFLSNFQEALLTSVSPEDTEKLHMQIAELKEKLVYMKQGIPADLALDYVRKKARAAEAELTQVHITAALEANAPTLVAARNAVTATLEEIDVTEHNTGLDGLPPLFSWPVQGRVTAGYLDAAYVGVFHVPHRGMDIAVRQGTTIRTVAEGIVYAVKDGGAKGYSYILIGHRNGYASLYGHVSASFVKAGDVVSYGQSIGLTGGQPGSRGSGPMTTGQHLHLEMMKDGAHFNPIEVLK